MAWNAAGRTIELCNCTMMCRCWLGPAVPDQGNCSGAFVFDIREGESDGVALAGAKVAFAAEWPADFWSGNGTARVYLDEGASEEQRRELEAIFGGKKGGPLEPVFAGVIANWLPPLTARITVQDGDSPGFTSGEIATATIQPLKDDAGNPTVVSGTAAQGAFQSPSMQLASAKGSRWSDPDMQPWEADSSTLHTFDWSG